MTYSEFREKIKDGVNTPLVVNLYAKEKNT